MKNFWLLTLFVSVLFSCSDSGKSNKNPNIPNYAVNAYLDTNLPLYSNLKFISNPLFVPNYGAQGLIVIKTGEGTYNAFDAACPNEAPNSCAALKIDGVTAVCSCDQSVYNLFSGIGNKEYPLKQYRVQLNGTVLHIYN